MPENTIGGRVIVVGAGPAGLAAAERLASHGVAVTIHERMPNPARKFLLAGRGGLNLTHSEPLDAFLDRYGLARPHLEHALRAFSPDALRAWCEELGVPTFVGSSGRIFPKTMKASPVLRAWLRRLGEMGVQLQTRSRWLGWDANGGLRFETPDGLSTERPDAAIFALGGASWPRLGSDGSWQEAFASHGARIAPLRPANSGFHVAWSDTFRERFAGEPLKSAVFTFGDESLRGEAMITGDGIEGGAIYALSSRLRSAIDAHGEARLLIDLRPDASETALASRLADDAAKGLSAANRLRRAGLSPLAASLLRERMGGPGLPPSPAQLAAAIKACEVRLDGAADIGRAISTAGGIGWESLATDYSLRADPATFACGEMLDWEAPTGGYLLQACFATGRAAAEGVLKRLAATSP
ncbi:MAG: TIGR03862 family flavoprotein [Alphaproteobacteria bacterium]|nr:TIGR03862 family flavoprotein [Alphaproteobacteria bacterium]